ncbi:hypothetical protein [Paraflavitalea speifideaquila]|uniref:hypothetical protein n=1 Tax=Paraflavitalea speifideaquila TaxID=3076558 RepID=UPI0028ED5D01|nr:hypothetical protein [Paraflavitalea speifideiaquila]
MVKTDRFKVSCFTTKHRIPCWGFRFDQVKAPRRVNPDKAIKHEVPASFYDRLKQGEDYETKSGDLIQNDWVTDPAPKPQSYAYSADTLYDEELVEKVQGWICCTTKPLT